MVEVWERIGEIRVSVAAAGAAKRAETGLDVEKVCRKSRLLQSFAEFCRVFGGP